MLFTNFIALSAVELLTLASSPLVLLRNFQSYSPHVGIFFSMNMSGRSFS